MILPRLNFKTRKVLDVLWANRFRKISTREVGQILGMNWWTAKKSLEFLETNHFAKKEYGKPRVYSRNNNQLKVPSRVLWKIMIKEEQKKLNDNTFDKSKI